MCRSIFWLSLKITSCLARFGLLLPQVEPPLFLRPGIVAALYVLRE